VVDCWSGPQGYWVTLLLELVVWVGAVVGVVGGVHCLWGLVHLGWFVVPQFWGALRGGLAWRWAQVVFFHRHYTNYVFFYVWFWWFSHLMCIVVIC
jgi:hypothetical protein